MLMCVFVILLRSSWYLAQSTLDSLFTNCWHETSFTTLSPCQKTHRAHLQLSETKITVTGKVQMNDWDMKSCCGNSRLCLIKYYDFHNCLSNVFHVCQSLTIIYKMQAGEKTGKDIRPRYMKNKIYFLSSCELEHKMWLFLYLTLIWVWRSAQKTMLARFWTIQCEGLTSTKNPHLIWNKRQPFLFLKVLFLVVATWHPW